VFRYRLHTADGDDLGEAIYAMQIKAGEEILLGAGRQFRVLDVVPFEEADELGVRGDAQGRGGLTSFRDERLVIQSASTLA